LTRSLNRRKQHFHPLLPGAHENGGGDQMAQLVAKTTGFDPLVAVAMMNSLYEDA